MENENLSMSARPQIYVLKSTMASIKGGGIRIPNFQRPFVWTEEQILSLFDSVYNGYPINSFLFWEAPANESIFTTEKLATIVIPEQNTTKETTVYVIDGHQRLSALFGCLQISDKPINSTSTVEQEERKKWLIYFDLEERKFTYHNSTKKIPNHYFPIRCLNTPSLFRRELHRIVDAANENKASFYENENRASFYENEIEKLFDNILSYQFSVVRLVGGNQKILQNVFTRVNSEGTKMKTDFIFSALTYNKDNQAINTTAKIDELIKGFKYFKNNDNERTNIFRVLMSALKLPVYVETKGKSNIQNFQNKIERITTAQLEHSLTTWQSAITAAVHFLESIGVFACELLPYNLQFVVICEFFMACPNPTHEQQAELEKWFWQSAYYSINNTNTSVMNQIRETVKQFALGKIAALKTEYLQSQPIKTPYTFLFTASRVKTFALFLFNQQKPRSFQTGEIIPNYNLWANLRTDEDNSLSFLFEIKELEKNTNDREKAKELRACVANRFITEPEYNTKNTIKMLRYWENTNPEVFQNILASHLINDKAYQALKNGDYAKFVEERFEFMRAQERIFMQSKGITPPNEDDNNDTEPDFE